MTNHRGPIMRFRYQYPVLFKTGLCLAFAVAAWFVHFVNPVSAFILVFAAGISLGSTTVDTTKLSTLDAEVGK